MKLLLKKKQLSKNWQRAPFGPPAAMQRHLIPRKLETPLSFWRPRVFFLPCTFTAHGSWRVDPWSWTAWETREAQTSGRPWGEAQVLSLAGSSASPFSLCVSERETLPLSPAPPSVCLPNELICSQSVVALPQLLQTTWSPLGCSRPGWHPFLGPRQWCESPTSVSFKSWW